MVTDQVSAPPDEVFDALTKVLRSLRFSLESTSRDSGIIRTKLNRHRIREPSLVHFHEYDSPGLLATAVIRRIELGTEFEISILAVCKSPEEPPPGIETTIEDVFEVHWWDTAWDSLIPYYMGGWQRVQLVLTGTVVDPGVMPLAGAAVQMEGTAAAVRTDDNGVFTLPVGRQDGRLMIRAPGHEPVIISMPLSRHDGPDLDLGVVPLRTGIDLIQVPNAEAGMYWTRIDTRESRIPLPPGAGGMRGSVRVAFTIRPNGLVTDVRVVSATPTRGIFDQTAMDSVRRSRFRPARTNPLALPIRTEIEVKFGGNNRDVQISQPNKRMQQTARLGF
jgi:TonB family protein